MIVDCDSRDAYPVQAVEYECTPLALSLTPVFASIVEWSDGHLADVQQAQRRFDDEPLPVLSQGSA